MRLYAHCCGKVEGVTSLPLEGIEEVIELCVHSCHQVSEGLAFNVTKHYLLQT